MTGKDFMFDAWLCKGCNKEIVDHPSLCRWCAKLTAEQLQWLQQNEIRQWQLSTEERA